MRSLRRTLIIGFFFVAVLGTVCHFVYAWTGYNKLIGYFVPVNESTFEHMKLLFFPALLWFPAALLYLKKEFGTFPKSFACGILTGTWFIPVFFYSYSGILGKNRMWLDIACFYIAVFITFYTTYRRTISDKRQHAIWIILLLLMTISFFFFTYHPADLGIFKIPSA